jgi:hypothetical protein
MTGVVPGFGTGAGTVISGVAVDGGRITPSDFSSLSLKVPVEPVEDGSLGSIFSAGILLGAGMLGACCCRTLGFWAEAAVKPPASMIGTIRNLFMNRSFQKERVITARVPGVTRLPLPEHLPS